MCSCQNEYLYGFGDGTVSIDLQAVAGAVVGGVVAGQSDQVLNKVKLLAENPTYKDVAKVATGLVVTQLGDSSLIQGVGMGMIAQGGSSLVNSFTNKEPAATNAGADGAAGLTPRALAPGTQPTVIRGMNQRSYGSGTKVDTLYGAAPLKVKIN